MSHTSLPTFPSLPDSVDTPTVLLLMKELVTICNVYLSETSQEANVKLLYTIATYLTQLLRVFGVITSDQGIGFPLQKEGVHDQVATILAARWEQLLISSGLTYHPGS